MSIEQETLIPLADAISPCQNVRRSCYSLMSDKISFDEGVSDGVRSVKIESDHLETLSHTITDSVIEKAIKEGKMPNVNSLEGDMSDDKHENYISITEKLDYASWDADEWHYTGKSYSRPHLSKEIEEKQRYERVALYIMVLDSINFCFWPVKDERQMGSVKSKNLLEYEHLTKALKKLAEQDDVLPENSSLGCSIDICNEFTIAENSYALAPRNLLLLESISKLLHPYLPQISIENKNEVDCHYIIPNSEERTRLIIELAQSLISYHAESATCLIAKANQSADNLVNLILQSCPGFRDTAVDGYKGRMVFFYKRAQILVADLWAALGSFDSYHLTHCHFKDIATLTTFADYRVPQLLRHLQVLQYAPHLEEMIDQRVEIYPFCLDELYLRAATIVAVDLLVNSVKNKLRSMGDQYIGLVDEVNAVKIDWFLWNIGEKLDRSGTLKPHHLVRTIFY